MLAFAKKELFQLIVEKIDILIVKQSFIEIAHSNTKIGLLNLFHQL